MTWVHGLLAIIHVIGAAAVFCGWNTRASGVPWLSTAMILASFAMGAKVVWP